MKDLYKELSNKRKELQDSKFVPEWYTTSGYQMFVDKYEYETETSVRGQFERIAKTASKHLEKVSLVLAREAEAKFFSLFWSGWLSPSTPVLANMGTNRGMPVSCSGSNVSDSIDGFYSAYREIALLTKEGFGTASYLGNIRPRGSKISKGGKSSGVVPVFNHFVLDMRSVTQGTARRGAWAGYLEITHGDFDELCDHVMAEPDDANVGWIITDDFVNGMKSGNSEYLRRYQKALKLKMVLGKGYFFFVDKANRNRPQMYKDFDLFIKNSQLCAEIMLFNDENHTYTCQPKFAPIIKKGYGITTLSNINVGDNIWSKSGWTTVKNKELTGVKSVSEYRTTNGTFIGTSDHRIVENGVKIEVKDAESIDSCLVAVDKINYNIIPEYVLNGLMMGDGTIRNANPTLCVGEKDYDYYVSEISPLIAKDGYKYFRKINLDLFIDVSKKTHERDIDLSDLNTDDKRVSFLRGLYTANGSAIKQTDGSVHIILTQTSKDLADKIQWILQSLGYSPRLYKTRGKSTKFTNGVYECKDRFDIKLLKNSDVINFRDTIGFLQSYKTEILDSVNIKVAKNKKTVSDIYEVNYIGEHEVYHIEVDNDTHTYWTGGLDVSNCVLSSMNVARYDEWKDTDAVYWATIFLDCVAEEFIERAKSISGLEKAVRFTEKSRALGLGQCGFHTYLQNNMIAFDSLDAMWKNTEIAKHISDESLKASKWMAGVLGEPEWCKGYGVRNTHRIAIAPTKSTAALMGGVSEGINPDPAMVYTQMTSSGEVERVNPALLKLMKERKVFNKKTIIELKDKMGSVQHVDWLSDDEKRVFQTAFEINQEVIIRLASQRAKYIDQWQSLNLFFSADESEAVISKVHQIAFEDENILALYYIYSSSGVQASNGECSSCS